MYLNPFTWRPSRRPTHVRATWPTSPSLGTKGVLPLQVGRGFAEVIPLDLSLCGEVHHPCDFAFVPTHHPPNDVLPI